MTSHKPPEPNKTLVGVPGDFQAAVDQLRAQQGDDPMRRTRMGSAGPTAPAGHAPPPLPQSRGFQQPAPGFAPPPAAPAPNAPVRLPSAEKTLIGMPGNLQEVLRAAEAARDARGDRSAEPRTRHQGSDTVLPPPGEPRVQLHLDEREASAHEPSLLGTRHLGRDLHPRASEEDPEATDVVKRPRLSLSERSTQRTAKGGSKLWPALALLGAVLVIGGGLFAWRMLRGSAAVASRSAEPALPSLTVADGAREPSGVPVAPAAVTEVSAATHAETSPQPTAAVELQAAPAELERQAIDLLIARDYASASRAYDRLRALAPDRKEYAVMFSLLTHGTAAACGQPGQEPCAR